MTTATSHETPARPADLARPGRLRRLVLTFAPLGVAAAVPYLMIAILGARLPETIVDDGDRLTRLAQAWLYQPPIIWTAVVLVIAFTASWRFAVLQRPIVMPGFAFGTLFAVQAVVETLLIADSQGVLDPPGWTLPVYIAAFAAGGALGWLLGGPAPKPPEASDAPPAGVFTLTLRPGQKAMFADTAWSRASLLAGGALLVLACATLRMPLFFALELAMALVLIAGARVRLRIDDAGVSLTFLGMVEQRIPYAHVEAAFAFPTPPERPAGQTVLNAIGAVSGGGPVLVLALTDGRELRFSTRSAVDAAALVNGRLTEERTDADHD